MRIAENTGISCDANVALHRTNCIAKDAMQSGDGIQGKDGGELMDGKEAIKMLCTIQRTIYLGNRKFDEAIDVAIKALGQPTIEPERTGKWIPVIERVPEKHGEMYLVTISDGSVYSCALQWDANQKRWYLSFLNNGKILVDYIDDVIAWMPLPEPCREEGEQR